MHRHACATLACHEKTPGYRFSPEISHNAAWMHTACVPPMQVLETPDIQHCSRNNGVCVGAPLFISSHRNPRRDFVPGYPPRTSALGLSYRPADAPRQIMIALISFDSRLSILSRDIVTRQDTKDKIILRRTSQLTERMKIDVEIEVHVNAMLRLLL